MAFKKVKPRKREKQSIINKKPKNYNESKPIPGEHKAVFVRGSSL